MKFERRFSTTTTTSDLINVDDARLLIDGRVCLSLPRIDRPTDAVSDTVPALLPVFRHFYRCPRHLGPAECKSFP